MREEDSILLKYPALYAECFDFSPPPGWRHIVEELCDALARDPTLRVQQVKQKFGELRFYVRSATPEQYAMIGEAETRSAHTCERCGAPGKLRSGGWLQTLCDGCAK